MNRDDIQKLLGGYATGTLTAEEQQALFEAALTDQALFDALAREEALRDVLSDPSARAHLLAAIDEAPARWYQRWWRPMVVMATAAAVIVSVAVYMRPPAPMESAKVELPRFVPPVLTPSTPVLPPAPEVRRAEPAMTPFKLPAPLAQAKASPPPPPPAASAPPSSGGGVLGGLLPSPAPIQQAQIQLTPAPMQQAEQSRFRDQQANVPIDARNALFDSSNVPLRGKVTDATGAVVPSASVAVKSLATGETLNTSTDAKGEFSAPEKPGSNYQISASKPGFNAATVNQATPVNGPPDPVNLRLDVGATAETVEVTAAAPTLPATKRADASGGGGRGGRVSPGLAGGALSAEMKKAKIAPVPDLEYHLMRRLQGGRLTDVPAGGTVTAGSALILRVRPVADGVLRITEGERTIASSTVRRGVMSETALPVFDQPGRVELQVYFSQQPAASKDDLAKQQAPSATITFNIR